jgi:hypothetical protein
MQFTCGKKPPRSAITTGNCASLRCWLRLLSSGVPPGSTGMSFFQCSECNGVEDTALCHYWSARLRETPTLCSACDPKIAKWHGQFPRESAKGWITDRHGFLYKRNEVERWLGQPIGSIT